MSSSNVSLSLQIASADLPALLAMAAKSGVSISAQTGGKIKKIKKEKDPDAPKKEANDWIKFTQHARSVLVAGGCELKGFIGQQYCAMLKEKLPMKSITDSKGKEKEVPDYDSISDSDILSRFKSWTPPEQSKAAEKKANSDAGSSAGSSPAAAPAEKPKRQWSEAAKAAAAEKRAATKAAKGAAAAVVPAKVTGGTNAAAGASPANAWSSPARASEPEGDITEFEPVKIGGVAYLRNCRGDILSDDYDWVGRYDEKTKKIDRGFKKPADLEE
jgi:hypothetical protein